MINHTTLLETRALIANNPPGFNFYGLGECLSKRALYLDNIALHPDKRALYLVKRVLYRCNRALSSNKSALGDHY